MIFEIIVIRNIPAITRFKLNTCVPYIIRYPIPALDVRNSPDITPIKHIDIFIFKEFKMFKLSSISEKSVLFFSWKNSTTFLKCHSSSLTTLQSLSPVPYSDATVLSVTSSIQLLFSSLYV